MERWGMAGVNYIANLIQSGRAAEAALIVSLPSYANAVIVAEENMHTVALNQDAVLAQENALAQDMQNPYLSNNAKQRAGQQALAAVQSELIDSGALGDYSGLEQEVKNAQWIADDSKTDLNHALQKEKAALNTLAKAQARFNQNLADKNAADAVITALYSIMEASYVRKKAEKTFASSQQALEDSLHQLDAARQKDMANVQAQAEQYLAELRLKQAEIRAGLNEQAGGQAGEPTAVQPDPLPPENVSNEGKEGNPLAPVDESVIINEGTQGETGDGNGPWDAGKPDGPTAEGARKSALPQAKVEEIIKVLKGSRPDPTTYLNIEYTTNHIAKFSNGVTKIVAQAPSGTAGPPSGTFVMPSYIADDLIARAGGNVSKLEQFLGLPLGSLGTNPVRIDVKNPTGLRLPSGNELGANSQWIPGGYTSGGLLEAIIDPPMIGAYIVTPIKSK